MVSYILDEISSMVEHLSVMHKAMGSIASTNTLKGGLYITLSCRHKPSIDWHFTILHFCFVFFFFLVLEIEPLILCILSIDSTTQDFSPFLKL